MAKHDNANCNANCHILSIQGLDFRDAVVTQHSCGAEVYDGGCEFMTTWGVCHRPRWANTPYCIDHDHDMKRNARNRAIDQAERPFTVGTDDTGSFDTYTNVSDAIAAAKDWAIGEPGVMVYVWAANERGEAIETLYSYRADAERMVTSE